MINPLVAIKNFIEDKQIERRNDLKNRVVKNKEVLLEAMGEVIEGGKQCPFLLGNKCIGKACQMFMSWNIPIQGFDDKGKQNIKKIWRCSFVQQPLLMVEQTQMTAQLLSRLIKQGEPKK